MEPSTEEIATREELVDKKETVLEGNSQGNSIRNEQDNSVGEENDEKIETLEEFLSRDTNGLIYLPLQGVDSWTNWWLDYLEPLVEYFKEIREQSTDKSDQEDNAGQEETGDGSLVTKHDKIRLVIVSRAHASIKMILKSLKTCIPAQGFRAITLASRDYYCINPDLKNSKNKNDECNGMRHGRSEHTCPWYKDDYGHRQILLGQVDKNATYCGDNNGQSSGDKNNQTPTMVNVLDIETLKLAGHQCSTCPYFAAREIAHIDADIIVTPYNYVLDYEVGTRDFYKELFKGSILFFNRPELSPTFGRAFHGNVTQEQITSLIDNLQERIHDLESLEPRRIILTTHFPNQIRHEVRQFLTKSNFKVILPKFEGQISPPSPFKRSLEQCSEDVDPITPKKVPMDDL